MPDFRALLGTGSFIFMRHAESEGNRDGLMQGRLPSRLTELGREQARRAGISLKPKGIGTLLSSPLDRARETAELVAAEAGVAEVRVMEELTEIGTGIFTGLTWKQARERHPDQYRLFVQRSWDAVPGAETSGELYDRAEAAWGELLELFRSGERTILAVTHSGFLQWIIRSTVQYRSWMPLFSASGNCHVSELAVDNRDLGGGERSLYLDWVRVNAPPSPTSPSPGA